MALRLWLVLSVLWVAGVGVVTWWTFPSDGLPVSWSEILSPELPPWAVPEREAVRFATLLAVLPPALVLAFGSALIWAFRGFR
jgi:hypothetical protein